MRYVRKWKLPGWIFFKLIRQAEWACLFQFFAMGVIRDDLNEQISTNPGMDYSVLIVLKEGVLPPSLVQKGRFVMDNKIFSATISGAEIQSLGNDAAVEAIEPDVEMTTL
jgi:hypothetical protein